MSELEGHTTDYGFVWGPVFVQRTCELREGTGVITIKTAHSEMEVYFSRTGRSLRVFRNGKELKEVGG